MRLRRLRRGPCHHICGETCNDLRVGLHPSAQAECQAERAAVPKSAFCNGCGVVELLAGEDSSLLSDWDAGPGTEESLDVLDRGYGGAYQKLPRRNANEELRRAS